ncbi:MAG: tetratricopeptide repeat protein [Acidobacteriota bacterium]|nr:tetratricopeptide repeat protein [Acidobacteriota bacterium]
MRLLVLLAALSLLAQDTDDQVARLAASASEAMQAGDYAVAEQRNWEIIRLRPKLAEAKVNLGLSLFLEKRYEDAIRAFAEGLRLKPAMANAWLFTGISQFNLNRPREALGALAHFTAEHPDDLQGQYFTGLAHLSLEQFSEAAQALLAARALDPRNIDVLYHLAQSYLGQARQNPAGIDSLSRLYEDVVKEIGALDPQSFRIAQLRAGYFEATGAKAEAIGELEALLRRDPGVRGLHYTLGCLYTESRQYDKALDQFDKEMRLDPPYPRTYFQLGHVYLALEKPAQAMPLLQKAIQVEPESAGLVWVDIGRAYRLMDDPRKASVSFEKAIALGQRNASVYYQLSMAARSAGDPQRSREALNISQRLRGEEKPKNLANQ